MKGLPRGWSLCHIGDVLLPVEKTDKDDQNREVWYIDISSINNEYYQIKSAKRFMLSKAPSRARQKIRFGDVLFSTVRPYLRKIAFVNKRFDGEIASTGFSVLRGAVGIDPKYLFFKSISHDFVSALTGEQYGVSYPAIKDEHIKAQPLELPPTGEQRRIVEKIEGLFAEIDKGVESLKAAQAALDHYRKSLLKAAFEGRLTADWRARNPDKLEDPQTLLTRIRKEREAKYQTALAEWKRAVSEWNNSGQMDRKPFKPKRPKEFPVEFANLQIALSDLPTGWTWSHLGWCSTGPEYGTAEKSSDHGDVPVIRMGNLQGGTIDWKNLVYTSNKVEIKQYSLNAGDVLFNRTNSPELVGKSAIYRGCKPALFAGYLVRINQIEEIVMGSYLAYFLNSPVARAHGKTVKTDGVNQSNINATKLLEYPFPYCSIAEQAQIVATLDIRLDAMKMLKEEIKTNLSRIGALRQSILKQAFSGKLVPQDPGDEPAAALLDRIKAQRAKKPPKPKPRKRKSAHP